MATTFTINHPPRPVKLPGPSMMVRCLWGPLAQGETGDRVSLGLVPGRTVHVRGTFGGATVRLVGNNFDDGSPFLLTDPLGAALNFTVAGGREVLENPSYIYPEVVGGDGTTSIEVALSGRLGNL